jgi:hypothetical protein
MYSTSEDFKNTFSKFKNAEKHYRGLKPPFKDENVIDFDNNEILGRNGITMEVLKDPNSDRMLKIFRFAFPPGFVVVREFLTIDEQLKASLQCITELSGQLNRKTPQNKLVHIRKGVQG